METFNTPLNNRLTSKERMRKSETLFSIVDRTQSLLIKISVYRQTLWQTCEKYNHNIGTRVRHLSIVTARENSWNERFWQDTWETHDFYAARVEGTHTRKLRHKDYAKTWTHLLCLTNRQCIPLDYTLTVPLSRQPMVMCEGGDGGSGGVSGKSRMIPSPCANVRWSHLVGRLRASNMWTQESVSFS